MATSKQVTFIFSLGIDSISAKDFAINLNEWSRNNRGCPLRIEINSGGGNFNDAVFLYETFARLRRDHHLTLVANGRAASTAGWLLQAGDWRVIGENSFILVHEVASKAEGTITQMKVELARCEQLQAQSVARLCRRSKLTPDRIAKEIAEKVDWWIPAEEALELGLVDEIEREPEFRGKFTEPTDIAA